mmetsp:Transcript_37571/g.58684  ORF Transcript_37571/g.58684 Transcript_37571/m.58684 type:complete len:354 (-) Transcript_37571:4-1065(-)
MERPPPVDAPGLLCLHHLQERERGMLLPDPLRLGLPGLLPRRNPDLRRREVGGRAPVGSRGRHGGGELLRPARAAELQRAARRGGRGRRHHPAGAGRDVPRPAHDGDPDDDVRGGADGPSRAARPVRPADQPGRGPHEPGGLQPDAAGRGGGAGARGGPLPPVHGRRDGGPAVPEVRRLRGAAVLLARLPEEALAAAPAQLRGGPGDQAARAGGRRVQGAARAVPGLVRPAPRAALRAGLRRPGARAAPARRPGRRLHPGAAADGRPGAKPADRPVGAVEHGWMRARPAGAHLPHAAGRPGAGPGPAGVRPADVRLPPAARGGRAGEVRERHVLPAIGCSLGSNSGCWPTQSR